MCYVLSHDIHVMETPHKSKAILRKTKETRSSPVPTASSGAMLLANWFVECSYIVANAQYAQQDTIYRKHEAK